MINQIEKSIRRVAELGLRVSQGHALSAAESAEFAALNKAIAAATAPAVARTQIKTMKYSEACAYVDQLTQGVPTAERLALARKNYDSLNALKDVGPDDVVGVEVEVAASGSDALAAMEARIAGLEAQLQAALTAATKGTEAPPAAAPPATPAAPDPGAGGQTTAPPAEDALIKQIDALTTRFNTVIDKSNAKDPLDKAAWDALFEDWTLEGMAKLAPALYASVDKLHATLADAQGVIAAAAKGDTPPAADPVDDDETEDLGKAAFAPGANISAKLWKSQSDGREARMLRIAERRAARNGR